MDTTPTRKQVDQAVRRALDMGAGSPTWRRWARRWLMGIDPRVDPALAAADADDDPSGYASAAAFAAAAWSNVFRNGTNDPAERLSSLQECQKFVVYVLEAPLLGRTLRGTP